MTSKGDILVGTVGQGVMMSADEGESWTRASVRQGMHSDCIVRMLRADSRSPEVVYAGTDFGLYRSDDGGGKWRRHAEHPGHLPLDRWRQELGPALCRHRRRLPERRRPAAHRHRDRKMPGV